MVPFIIVLAVCVGLIFALRRLLAQRGKEGAGDYEAFFQENAKKK